MVLEGAVFDVIVDIRKGSPMFGKWQGFDLSSENHRQLYAPPGCAHGFCVTSEWAVVLYKCTDFYSPKAERGIIWNDPALAISWPITPSSSTRFVASSRPRVTAIEEWAGSRPVANAFSACSGIT